eukprot:m.119708 g.119708  ORF g.119708 m.119708 type:complete len:111 (+) comp16160_c0_seq2:219-551(+)
MRFVVKQLLDNGATAVLLSCDHQEIRFPTCFLPGDLVSGSVIHLTARLEGPQTQFEEVSKLWLYQQRLLDHLLPVEEEGKQRKQKKTVTAAAQGAEGGGASLNASVALSP